MRITSHTSVFADETAYSVGVTAPLTAPAPANSRAPLVSSLENNDAVHDAVSRLNADQALILLVAASGDERNAVYDPLFGAFAKRDKRSHVYARTTDPLVGEKYGIKDFPSVLILSADGASYLVKDRLAVVEEAGYFTLPVADQLKRIERRFNDPVMRGSAIIAYGLTARDATDKVVLEQATRELTAIFSDPNPPIRDAALYSCGLICEQLPDSAKKILLTALIPLFANESTETAFEAMSLVRKTAESLGDTVTFKDVAAVTTALKTFFGAADPDLSGGALITYASFARFLNAGEIESVIPAFKELARSDHDMQRWSAVYAYGELLPHIAPTRRADDIGFFLRFLNDPYGGIRHRVLLIIEANWDLFVPDRAAPLAPALRALFAEPTQLIDVCETSIRFYAQMNVLLGADERERGIGELRKIADDPEELDEVRAAARTGLEELLHFKTP